jgi:hypothetical protein
MFAAFHLKAAPHYECKFGHDANQRLTLSCIDTTEPAPSDNRHLFLHVTDNGALYIRNTRMSVKHCNRAVKALAIEFGTSHALVRFPQSRISVPLGTPPGQPGGIHTELSKFEEHLLNKRLARIRFDLLSMPQSSPFRLEATRQYECAHVVDACQASTLSILDVTSDAGFGGGLYLRLLPNGKAVVRNSWMPYDACVLAVAALEEEFGNVAVVVPCRRANGSSAREELEIILAALGGKPKMD